MQKALFAYLPPVDSFSLEPGIALCYTVFSKQMEDVMKDYSFGNFLQELRMRRGLTQYQLGALVGVSDKAVSKWENGSSKPQSGILYKLGEVLGVSVDELLSCKYQNASVKEEQGVFAMKKQLWNRAEEALCTTYGGNVPVEIASRFYAEQAEMQGTDMIVFFVLLSTLSQAAKKSGSRIFVRGGTGASLVAYLLGATEINPLPSHYHCPACHRVVFDDAVTDGWDLPQKMCTCGHPMIGDGHNLPFAVYRHVIHGKAGFDLSVSPEFLSTARALAEDFFRDLPVTVTLREEANLVTLTVDAPRSCCKVNLYTDETQAKLGELERLTATSFDRVPFACREVLEAFIQGDTDGIPEFDGDRAKQLLRSAPPESFARLISYAGVLHGGEQTLPYRDDVYQAVESAMKRCGLTDMGLAYKVMTDTRRGLYARDGIPEWICTQLKSIGMEETFLRQICSIRYLFPKAHGTTCVKNAVILMWYKLHHSKEFIELFY